MKSKPVAPGADFRSVPVWTGDEALAAEVRDVAFPELLAPVDDVPPATLITGVRVEGSQRIVRGVPHDNGTVAAITVNGRPATIVNQHAGVADWSITLDAPPDDRFVAKAADTAGNAERTPHELSDRPHYEEVAGRHALGQPKVRAKKGGHGTLLFREPMASSSSRKDITSRLSSWPV